MENRFVNGFANKFAKRFASKAWYWQKVALPRTPSKPVTSKCGGREIVLLGSRLTMLAK